MNKGIVTDIQRASIHDGPGIRTTVFLKGCPLHCEWCHNPESIRFEPQTLFYPEKCLGCNMCSQGCFSGARVLCGKEMSVEEVMNEVLLDKEYYGTEGGVTISGGEPFAQRQFLSDLVDACKTAGIHCAVETSLIYYDEEILKKLDLCIADLKIWDNQIHKRYTGVENIGIKENFLKLDRLGIPIIVRTPIIPEVTQEIPKISAFFKGFQNVTAYEILPYHPLGNSKRKALGEEPREFTVPSSEYMEELRQYVFVQRPIAGNA